jgi:hypothetical protein
MMGFSSVRFCSKVQKFEQMINEKMEIFVHKSEAVFEHPFCFAV